MDAIRSDAVRLTILIALVSLSLTSCTKKQAAGSELCSAGTSEKRSESPAGVAMWCERSGGVKHGAWRELAAEGSLLVEGQYADGKMDGIWTHYHPPAKAPDPAPDPEAPAKPAPAPATPPAAPAATTSPAKERQGAYQAGRKVGVWTRWYAEGTKAREATHDPATTIVPWTTWRDDGSKWATGTVVELRDQGEYTEWHSNGKLATKGVYEKGEKVGEWQYWDIDGNPSTTPQGDIDVQ